MEKELATKGTKSAKEKGRWMVSPFFFFVSSVFFVANLLFILLWRNEPLWLASFYVEFSKEAAVTCL
jgi:hypothetical protein